MIHKKKESRESYERFLLSLMVGFCLVGILAVVDWGQVINLLVAFINLLIVTLFAMSIV
jgi:hypothetical protein